MPGDLLSVLSNEIVLGDGAIGTELYARGVFINRCFEELNLTDPNMVLDLHRAYRQAGAQILTTNSYGGNRTRLGPFGLAEQLETLNRRAVELAKEIARDDLWVAASIGPLRHNVAPLGQLPYSDAKALFAEQAQALADAGPDLIALETFRQPEMLDAAIDGVRSVTDLPLLASFVATHLDSHDEDDVGPRLLPEQWARRLEQKGADMIGTNCVLGPQGVLNAIERMAHATEIPLVAMPNAGYPEHVAGRTLYLASPEYMAEYARRLAMAGARIVGGCCGTTPAMIREMGSFLKSVQVQRHEIVTVPPAPADLPASPPPMSQRSKLGAWIEARDRFAISVELSPPRGTDPTRILETARKLKDAGIDFINIPDGPRAVPRMSNATLARLIHTEVGVETILHVCCRDRNVLGLQMDLLGNHVDGIANLLCVTGDPPKMGNHPEATAVFDLDAVGLLQLVRNLNHGLDLGSSAIKGSTAFVPGCGVNPGAPNRTQEIDRLKRKLDAGASYIFSQPVYEQQVLASFLDEISTLRRVPFLVGILPLASLANAEFFHNEVPGMQVPKEVRDRLGAVSGRDEQAAVGIQIAQETLANVYRWDGVDGAYLFPPFGRVEGVIEVLSVIER